MTIRSAQVTDKSEQALILLPLGRSEAMRRVHEQIRRLASTDTPTLIYGETRTGKELVATALHRLSRRASGPTSALTVVVSRMASSKASSSATSGGVYRGIPGTHRTIRGRARWYLFLDEIGDISPAVQIRLLRVLETKCVEPVGSHRARGRCSRPCRNEQTPLGRSGRWTISQGPLLSPQRHYGLPTSRRTERNGETLLLDAPNCPVEGDARQSPDPVQ